MYPLVSVIIPAYNAFSTLKETVDSVLAQAYEPIEILVIDDGSNDQTPTLFEDFESQGVCCVRVQNGGASKARNIGLQKAKGAYIQFLDADDILRKDKIQLQMEVLVNSDEQMSFCDWSYFRDKQTLRENFIYNKIPKKHIRTGNDVLFSMGEEQWFIPVFCWLVSRDVLEDAGYWDEDLTTNDDGEFFSRVLLENPKVTHISKILGYYRKSSGDTLSTPSNAEKVSSAMQSYKSIEVHILNKNVPRLLVYPKSLYYTLFLQLRKSNLKQAKKVAREYNKLKATIEIKPRILQRCIALFGLEKGYYCYEIVVKIVQWLK